MRTQGLAERIFCDEHQWKDDGTCKNCGQNYHRHQYLQLKLTRVQLLEARLEIQRLKRKLRSRC